jgi:NAD(P)-dependent dehydrogenase (short-subunit alcohol dehydrogenase family)
MGSYIKEIKMKKDLNDYFSINNKIAIITGASRGIGEGIAKLFSKAGARLVICSRDKESIEETADSIIKQGGRVIPVAANISDASDREKIITAAMDLGNRVDILVNNAGANPSFGGLEDLSEAAFDKVININLKSTLFLSQLAYKTWMEKNGGVILNVSSIGGFQCSKGINGYNVVKAALNHLTRCMASEWGPQNVRVNALAPGVIKTQFSQALWENPKFKAMIKANPIPRFGKVEDLSGAALFLASDAASYITGHTLVIDGGTLVKD